jgi:hypothetical protein
MQRQGSAILRPSVREAVRSPSTPVGWRHLLWLFLLVITSVAFSLGLACATPLAAFGAAAALTLSRRDALVVILSVWLANQLVGFTVLSYPWTASTFAWGAALGAAAVFATLTSQWAARHLAEAARAITFAATFLVAFAAYEAVLFAVAVALLGGTEDFTGEILGRILAINAAAFVGLVLLDRVAASVGLLTSPTAALSMSERQA